MRSIPSAALIALLITAPLEPISALEPADGSHEFDFNVGTWHTHISRQTKALSDTSEFVEMDGTVTVRKIWDGRASLEEIEVDGPKGHWEGMTLFLYNPQAHQWSQSFAGSQDGTLQPPLIGSFKNGKGELYCQDTFNGRSILIRGTWSQISADAHHYQEDYSANGGQCLSLI